MGVQLAKISSLCWTYRSGWGEIMKPGFSEDGSPDEAVYVAIWHCYPCLVTAMKAFTPPHIQIYLPTGNSEENQATLTRLADLPGPNIQMLAWKKMLFLLPENINPVSYCLLVSFYRWFAAQYRVIRIADVARPRSALNHRGVISVTNKKSENRHKFTRNAYSFNLRGRSLLAHNPRHLSQCCCWSGANWIMPLPVFVLNLSHDFD